MKHYIAKLENESKTKLFIKSLEKDFPQLKFEYVEETNWCATLIVKDSKDEFISEYELTNYNITKVHYFKSGKNDFNEIISTDAIRKIYIRFMKNNFPEYREDYLKACNNTALDNLGELNNEM